MFSKYSAVNNAITPPNLYPVHHPTTAIAAPAAIDLPSFALICSILNASTVISCVAEAIAMTSPTLINKARFCVGFIKLQINKLIKIIICIRTIHPLLWPNFFVKSGI